MPIMDEAKLIMLAMGDNSLITYTKLIQARYCVAIALGNGPFILKKMRLASNEQHGIDKTTARCQEREAVIDKNLSACPMAKELKADIFLIFTAVEKVSLNYGKPDQKSLDFCTVEDAKRYIDEGHFAPGSMLPKIQAMIDFVESTGNRGIITDPAHLYEAVTGRAGTEITC